MGPGVGYATARPVKWSSADIEPAATRAVPRGEGFPHFSNRDTSFRLAGYIPAIRLTSEFGRAMPRPSRRGGGLNGLEGGVGRC